MGFSSLTSDSLILMVFLVRGPFRPHLLAFRQTPPVVFPCCRFLRLRRNGPSSEIINQTQDFPEQFPRHRHLGQLEGDVPAMAGNPSSNLDQLLPQRGQGPVLDLLWQSQRPHEVAEIVGQGVKLEPDGVVAEPAARQPRSPDGVLAFLNILLRFLPRAPSFKSTLGLSAPLLCWAVGKSCPIFLATADPRG